MAALGQERAGRRGRYVRHRGALLLVVLEPIGSTVKQNFNLARADSRMPTAVVQI